MSMIMRARWSRSGTEHGSGGLGHEPRGEGNAVLDPRGGASDWMCV